MLKPLTLEYKGKPEKPKSWKGYFKAFSDKAKLHIYL